MSELKISGYPLEDRPESVTVGGVRFVPDDGRDRNRLNTEDVMVALAFLNGLGYGYDAETDSMGLYSLAEGDFVAWYPDDGLEPDARRTDEWIRMARADLLISCLTPVAYWKVDDYQRHFGDRDEAVDFMTSVGRPGVLVRAYSAEGKVIPGR